MTAMRSIRRRRSRTLLQCGLVTAIVILGLSAGPHVQANNAASFRKRTPPSAVRRTPEAALQNEITVRTEFDLDASKSYVENIDRNSYNRISPLIGIPVTAAEDAVIAHREAIGSVIPRVDSLERRSRTYGGSWINQAQGGVVHIAFTEAPSANVRSEVTHLFPKNTKIVFQHSRLTRSTLMRVANSLGLKMRSLRASGVEIVGNVLELPEDVVDVYVSSSLAPASNILSAQYGPNVIDVIEEPASSALKLQAGSSDEVPLAGGNRNITSGPVYGGEYVTSGPYSCTAGFSNSHGNNVKTNIFMITAGHCQVSGKAWVQGYTTGTKIGAGGDNGFYGYVGKTSYCDCQTVGVLPTGKPTADVLVNDNATYHYTQLPAAYYTGEPACVSVAQEYTKLGEIICGTITGLSGSLIDQNVSLVQQIQTSVTNTLGGDSGAPWGNGGQYLGVHVGLLNGHAIFSQSIYISQYTNTTPEF
jgi:hypothetical protein